MRVENKVIAITEARCIVLVFDVLVSLLDEIQAKRQLS